MSFKSILQNPNRVLSFELFPPKTPKGETSLYQHVEQLVQFNPDFITCTYGAGGTTRDKTLDIVTEVKRRFNVPVASHLTLVNSSVEQLRAYLQQARVAKIDAIVALRGDPPQGETKFSATVDGLKFANELVDLIHSEFNEFGVAVAGYPEVHIEAPNQDVDLENLKRKVDAGADVVITQLFYDNADFFQFRERCDRAGINVPILPGLLPITRLDQVERITALCGSKLPGELSARLSEKDDDADWHFKVGVEHAVAQVDDLLDQSVDGIHFYVLNRSQAVIEIMSAMQNEFVSANAG